MAFWRNSSIRTKVLLAFGSVFLAAAGLGLFDMSQTARVEAAAENIRDEWLPSTAGLGRLAMAASAYRNAEGRALIAALSNDADGTRRSVAEYAAATTVADRLLRDYRAQINPDTYEFQTMHDFDVGWNRTKQLGAEVISLIEHGKAPAAFRFTPARIEPRSGRRSVICRQTWPGIARTAGRWSTEALPCTKRRDGLRCWRWSPPQ